MQIKEFLEKLDIFSDEERKKYLILLWEKVTPLSKQTLLDFQNGWHIKGFDKNGNLLPFEEFIKQQNKIIKECVELEVSEIGNMVRKELKLDPLSYDTEI